MKAFAKKPATYEDLRNLPEDMLGQLIAAELIASPRPALSHVRAASVLGTDIGGPFDRGRGGPGGWWILDEPELHLGADVLVPDLAGWRRERTPTAPAGAFTEIVPDWVCEVTSPSTAGIDRVRKLPLYARAGVPHAWIVDPVGRSLEVFRLEAGGWKLVGSYGGDDRVRPEPFDAVELELSALWLPDEVSP